MSLAETIDRSEDLFARALMSVLDLVTPRATPTSSDATDRAIRSLVAPLVEAPSEEALDRAFEGAVEAFPETLHTLLRRPSSVVDPSMNDAARMLPWLLQRTAGDLDASVLVAEFGAMLQLQQRMFLRLLAKTPSHVVDRALDLRRDDLQTMLRDPLGRSILTSQASLFALLGLHEALGRSAAWRRQRVVFRGLEALHVGVDLIPSERSFAETRWLIHSARELGLWPRSANNLSRSIDAALAGTPFNRAALLALRERLARRSTLLYVGDVRATFDQLLGGDVLFETFEEHLAAGECYERAELSIDELAQRWSLDVPDAVARLEELKIARPSSVLRLSEEARRQRLAKLDADRLARRAGIARPQDLVRRSVIASQRIEGIDARPHFTRTSPGERTRS